MSNEVLPLELRSRLNLESVWMAPFVGGWPVSKNANFIVHTTDPLEHIEPAPLVMLTCWADEVRAQGGSVEVAGGLRTTYTYRSGLLNALLAGPRPQRPIRHHAPPVRVLDTDRKKIAFTELADALDINSLGENAAFSKSLSEALNNVFEHAAATRGCAVAASRFEGASRVTLAIADAGRTVRGHMRERHGHDITDAEAVRRAIEPGISGTAAPGAKGKARHTPTNAGLGLFVMREIAARTGGRFALVSGSAGVLVQEDEIRTRLVESPWPGTVVCVSYSADQSHRAVEAVDAAIREGMSVSRKREPFSFDPLTGEGERVIMQPTFRGFIEDKAVANALREEQLLPAIDAGRAVEIDLRDGTFIAHSCAHALVYEVIRRAGADAKKRVHVRATSRQIKDVVRSIGFTAQAAAEEDV